MKTASSFSWLIALALPLLLTGCGQSGPKTYQVSGLATFAGNPIPDGWVIFTPNSAEQNSGPQGRARIQSGKFDTRVEGGKGVTGGPTIVRIEAYDGNGNDAALNGAPIMAPYEMSVDLPKQKTAQDFEVPATWARQRFTMPPP
ncbi:hypothetical protein [Anatilimnocola floriformis]|uniref:hypothetical protein n=1 Tax=Anatilimnocola floriformis TaxID=2948575 RepID=UPI0020C4B8D9|nr:hypothetical protein [Anatilimnocola floriformis]